MAEVLGVGAIVVAIYCLCRMFSEDLQEERLERSWIYDATERPSSIYRITRDIDRGTSIKRRKFDNLEEADLGEILKLISELEEEEYG